MRHLLIILIILLTRLTVVGQTYYSFPIDSAFWSVEYGNYGQWGYECFPTVHYGMIGDTSINGNNYSKVYENSFLTGNVDSSFNPVTATYKCALREDSSKNIFVIRPSDSSAVILYDFSLSIGDTFCSDYFYPGWCSIVENVDSIFVFNSYRKVIEIKVTETQRWIEGIGNIYGLFEILETGTLANNLRCFQEDGILKYGQLEDCHCGQLISISEVETNNKLIKVYPNPTTSKINIEIGNHFENDHSLELYSVLGNRILSINTKSEALEMDFSKLPAGIYILSIIDREGRLTIEKVIKNKP